MGGEYSYDLFAGTHHECSIKILQGVMKEYVYPTQCIEEVEIAAHSIITGLLDKFVKAILHHETFLGTDDYPTIQKTGVDEKLIRLMSDDYLNNYTRESSEKAEEERLYLRLLLVTDYICGMSDSFAKSLYQKLEGIY